MFVPVRDYIADWDPKTNRFRIVVHVSTSPQPLQLPVETPDEFVALMLMLGKPGVMIDNPTLDIRVELKAGT